jgi:hypothetical protein
MLGQQAQALLSDVFPGQTPMAAGLARAHRITRRVVRWGDEEPQAFDHAALVIAGDRLTEALPWVARPSPAPSAEVLLSTTPPEAARLLHFGRREAMAMPVELAPDTDRGAALIEALDEGWLFLIPTGGDAGWLLTVGAETGQGLRESRLIAPVVASTGAVAARFDTAPRVLDNCATPDRLTLGSAALALDPICGDGTATAVRGGILAAAVAAGIVGIDQPGLDCEAASAHYRARMIATMRRHLAVSWPFYARGGRSAWWQDEAAALAEGHAWCTRQLAEAGEAQFTLAGDRLIARDVAA